jgi:hypothetical protein
VQLKAPEPVVGTTPQFLPPVGVGNQVQLGAPEFGSVRELPAGASPIGFPR